MSISASGGCDKQLEPCGDTSPTSDVLMFWLPSREAMVPPSLPCPPSCPESCVVLLHALSDRCPLLLQPREALHGMGMRGCAQYASACCLALVVLWVVERFCVDKRSFVSISPGCYPGLRAGPLSGTDLSRWAVLCLMWPKVIKSGPAGWCLPPPSFFSLLSLCLLAFTQNSSDWWLWEGCRCFPCHDTAIDQAASANSSVLTLIHCLQVWGFVSSILLPTPRQ